MGSSDRPETQRALSALQLPLPDPVPPYTRGLVVVTYPLLAVLHCPQPDLAVVIGRLSLPSPEHAAKSPASNLQQLTAYLMQSLTE